MSPHVLIVDADISAAQVTSALIQRTAPTASITIEATPNGAWRSLQRSRADVVIVDPSPHNPRGMLFLRLLKETNPAMLVIVLASSPTPTLRSTLSELDVDLYLEKPVVMAQLVDYLRAALDGYTAVALPVRVPAPLPV